MVNPLIFAGVGILGMLSWMNIHKEIPPPEPILMNIQDIQLVAEGLIEGALEIEGLKDIISCV